MASDPKQNQSPAATSSTQPTRHKSERYEIVEIHRSEIKEADYNPRYITDKARRKLRAAIEKVGLLAPITWNRLTGRIVGGHQRLRALDALNGSRDYVLRVAAVEMDEAEEKAANLLLNNTEAQGEWDLEKLTEMLKAPDLDIVAAGFDVSDIFNIVGDDAPDTVLDEISNRVEQLREIDKGIAASFQESGKNSSNYYLVLIFRDDSARLRFTEALGLEDNCYQDGAKLQALLTEDKPKGVSDMTDEELAKLLDSEDLDEDERVELEAEFERRFEGQA